MDICFEATDDAIDIAQDYLVLRTKLNAIRKKIDLIRKKIDSRDLFEYGQYSAFTKINDYYSSLSHLIDLSEVSLAEILDFGREIAYNAEQINKAMNMEDEQ